eukprot:2187122-Rhodomonas_salina.1
MSRNLPLASPPSPSLIWSRSSTTASAPILVRGPIRALGSIVVSTLHLFNSPAPQQCPHPLSHPPLLSLQPLHRFAPYTLARLIPHLQRRDP